MEKIAKNLSMYTSLLGSLEYIGTFKNHAGNRLEEGIYEMSMSLDKSWLVKLSTRGGGGGSRKVQNLVLLVLRRGIAI